MKKRWPKQFVRSYGLVRALGRQLETIRKYYRSALNIDDRTGQQQWIYDNFYLVYKEGQYALRELKKADPLPGKKSRPEIFGVCVRYLEQCGCAFSEESLDAFLQEASLNTAELFALPLMLKAALIFRVAALIAEKDPKELTGTAITSLRQMVGFDFAPLLLRHSAIDKILSRDPAEIYDRMDEKTRDIYRQQVFRYSLSHSLSEEEAARSFIEAARVGDRPHVGHYIPGISHPGRRRESIGLAALIAAPVISLLLSVFLSCLLKNGWAGVLVFLPLWEAVRPLVEYFALKTVPPSYLPRLDYRQAVPEEAKTVVVVSTLVPEPEKAAGELERLKNLYHTCGAGEVYFCLLADFREADEKINPRDRLAVSYLQQQTRQLNRELEDRFLLFVRPREFSKTQQRYCGRERKRGAITELVRYLKGEEASVFVAEGNFSALSDVRFLMALDSDTRLLMDTVSSLCGIAMHPVNRPVAGDRRVVRGYGIIAPGIGVDLKASLASRFARIMAGGGGVSSYSSQTGNFYQDLFAESIFAGKGLIDIDMYHRFLDKAFLPERVLSHDIVEGGFLRTAFATDVEVTDSFPSRAKGYFDRLHRWTRGDVQNLFWCLRRCRAYAGKGENPFDSLSKYKVFDNLRRVAASVIALLSCAAAVFSGGRWGAVVITAVAAYVFLGPLFAASRAVVRGGVAMLSRRYYSRCLPQATELLARAALEFSMVPATAWTCLDAGCRALWRLGFTGRGLMEWTTAQEADKASAGRLGTVRRFWPGLVVGLAMAFLAPSGLVKLSGLAFAAFPLFAFDLSLPLGEVHPSPDGATREKLLSWAGAMWRYYEDYANLENHFLPPDNVQFSPVFAVARRTSPTNIGMLLTAAVSARELAFIDADGLVQRVSRTVDTLEKMEKWNGHLYNWYDTATLRPLHPRYVSTVDSGNLLCALIVLRQALREISLKNGELLARIDRLIQNMDMGLLYHSKRRLFHIGYDPEKGELSTSFYDLYASEARLASFYSVASRQVPLKHWGILSRTIAAQGRFTGPVSWTGTMFEYLMPALFLPVYKGSMDYEAVGFCLHCQQGRTAGKKVPWGISESSFYSFDQQLCYQYKAHGVQKLGLKRGLDSELVVAPYATFLALPFATQSAVRNLDALKRAGAWGDYGFYESVDYTKGRTASGYAIIKSYMAHHVGMSLAAVCNTLCGGALQRLFMSHPAMKSAAELLEEKIPVGSVVFEDERDKEIPEKTGRGVRTVLNYDQICLTAPRVHTLSNGEWTCMESDSGCGVSSFAGMDMTRFSPDPLRRPTGFFVLARHREGQFSVTKAPFCTQSGSHRAEFAHSYAAWYARHNNIEAGMLLSVDRGHPGERREIVVRNHSGKKETVSLLVYFEPVVGKRADDRVHPAFSKLFLRTQTQEGLVLFSRRKRDDGRELFLCAGSLSPEVHTETSREVLMTRPEGVCSLWDAFEKPFGGGAPVPDPACAFRVDVTLGPRGQKSLTFALAAGYSEEEAVENWKAVAAARRSMDPHMPMTPGSAFLCETLLPRLFYPCRGSKESIEARRENTSPVSVLWSMGISGDLPIALLELEEGDDPGRAEDYLLMQRSLRLCGIRFDFVIGYREGGEYTMPVSDRLRSLAAKAGAADQIGRPGGVHLVDLVKHDRQAVTVLRASARYLVPRDSAGELPLPAKYIPKRIHPSVKAEFRDNAFAEGGYRVSQNPALPWCRVYANNAFGTLLSDRALGYTWAVNSRENKLTPWFNDTSTDNRGEMVLVKSSAGVYDLVNGSTALFLEDRAVYTGVAGDLSGRVEVTIPRQGMAKRCRVTLSNRSQREISLELAYYTEPVLGVDRENARYIKAAWNKGGLYLENPFHAGVPGVLVLTAEGGADFCNCNRPGFLAGRWDEGILAPAGDCCAAAGVRRTLAPGETLEQTFVLGFSATLSGAEAVPGLQPSPLRAQTRVISIQTPDPALDALFAQLPHQIVNARMRGRTGFYQCGGAFGFRDQLQDSLAAILFHPALTRRQILQCCAHQFPEGDVLHWWHRLPKNGGGTRGVRTRYTDDLLWLPYAVAEYVEKTGDKTLLGLPVPYVSGPELEEEEKEKYMVLSVTPRRDTVYRHCLAALNRGATAGEHGLPLMQGGDWNDGFNRVGVGGRGESVWLAQFLALTLDRFALICEEMGDGGLAKDYREKSTAYKGAADRHAWDGEWYLRAFYDDGTPMGSASSRFCRIDLLPQSFAVLSGMENKERIFQALNSAWERLTVPQWKTIRLFAPAFEEGDRDPGYVRDYPPGIRENGGQYTHAAIWFAMALLRAGRTEQGYEALQMLNPARRYEDPVLARAYGNEPYAMTADIYDHPRAQGRGGWSLYTGAAAWYYKLVAEELLGLKLQDGKLTLRPNVPDWWEEFSITLTGENGALHITAKRAGEGETAGIYSGGKKLESIDPDGRDGGKREITVIY